MMDESKIVRFVVRKIEEFFDKEDLYLPPRKKSRLTILIYEEIKEQVSQGATLTAAWRRLSLRRLLCAG